MVYISILNFSWCKLLFLWNNIGKVGKTIYEAWQKIKMYSGRNFISYNKYCSIFFTWCSSSNIHTRFRNIAILIREKKNSKRKHQNGKKCIRLKAKSVNHKTNMYSSEGKKSARYDDGTKSSARASR